MIKILILGASGFLGGKVYLKLKKQANFKVVGTCHKAYENDNLKRMNVKNVNDVKEIFNEYKPDVVVWCLLDRNNEKELTDIGLINIMRNIDNTTKFIYISTDAFVEGKGNYSEELLLNHYNCGNPVAGYVNAKVKGEEIVKNHKNHIIIRTGPLYGQDIEGNWDKRISNLIDSLSQNQTIHRSSNLYKTFVYVDDLADLIYEMIEMDFKGLIHVGPEQKESYYTFNRKMARKLGLDENLVIEDTISIENAIANGIPLDTSMNTSKCKMIFKTSFRNV
ncbi:sugar nucleotide-binding protein [Clostridium sp. OS1-26]|uniref:sugar nucleotide-binding protein n=1 Tax=Clostridium sp. OS1-26 TaxID=3070681 RepID=UPI0027E0586E|nr:sugar nucleotide-binding protein [Clostridium sp. OS1-26]WML33475.1 sugar nucleotide-binding protein [Clostridium sp. OS1-26]